jgi:Transposase DDE domain
MQSQDSATTRLDHYIVHMLPWAHGHQRKAIRDFVRAIIDQQTGCQAQLARSFGNQEAATKRLSRLLHNERLEPRHLADAVLLQALVQLPAHGPVRLAIDWTIEGHQHLLVVSLIVGRRAVPIYWRAYDAAVLKGRMKRYELAVIRRAVTRVIQKVGCRRVRVTADRGFADVALFTLLTDLRVAFVIRVKKSTKICIAGVWQKLDTLRFAGNTRRRALGRLLYCAGNPQPLWVTMSRKRDAHGKWGLWYLVANRPYTAEQAVAEYAHRPGCEAGFREAKWWLGFAQARIKQSTAWSRLFALVAIALLVVVTLASRLLLRRGEQATVLLRRVTSRRRGRCELSLVSAMISLLQQDSGLYDHLAPRLKLKLEGDLANMS